MVGASAVKLLVPAVELLLPARLISPSRRPVPLVCGPFLHAPCAPVRRRGRCCSAPIRQRGCCSARRHLRFLQTSQRNCAAAGGGGSLCAGRRSWSGRAEEACGWPERRAVARWRVEAACASGALRTGGRRWPARWPTQQGMPADGAGRVGAKQRRKKRPARRSFRSLLTRRVVPVVPTRAVAELGVSGHPPLGARRVQPRHGGRPPASLTRACALHSLASTRLRSSSSFLAGTATALWWPSSPPPRADC